MKEGRGRSEGRWLAFLLLLAALPYLPCTGHGFVYDDETFVTNNPTIATMGKALGAFGQRYWRDEGGLDFYRPLTILSLAADRSMGGGAPAIFHGTNLLLHLLSTLLFVTLLRHLAVPRPWAIVAASFFALWPTGVEAVAWVSGRGDLLATLLGLAAAWILLPDRGMPRRTAAAAALLVFGALLSKESALAQPFLLALLLRAFCPENQRRARFLPFVTGQLVAVAAYFLLRLQVLGALFPRGGTTVEGLPLLRDCARFLVHGPALLLNLSSGLNPRWPWPELWPWGELLGLALLLVLPLFLAWRWRKKDRRPLALLILFWLALAPALLQIPAGYGLARRYLYGPSLFLSLLASLGLSKLPARVALPAFAAALCLLLPLTAHEASLFHDSETLWRAEGLRNPGWRVAPFNLGNALRARGALADAEAAYARAAELDPRRAEIFVNLGATRSGLGQREGAVDALRKAVALDPASARGWNNLGNALLAAGRGAESLEAFERAVALAPRDGVVRYNQARSLHALGRGTDAQDALKRALALQGQLEEPIRALRLRWSQEAARDQGVSCTSKVPRTTTVRPWRPPASP